MAKKEIKKENAKATTKESKTKKITKPATTKKVETKKVSAKTDTKKTAVKNNVKKTPAKKEKKPENTIQKILTPTNNDNVILYNDQNEPMEFEQIALIPYKENLYCILRPLELDGIEQDEAIVFVIKEEGENIWLDVVDEEEVIDDIFDIYYQLYSEAEKSKK